MNASFISRYVYILYTQSETFIRLCANMHIHFLEKAHSPGVDSSVNSSLKIFWTFEMSHFLSRTHNHILFLRYGLSSSLFSSQEQTQFFNEREFRHQKICYHLKLYNTIQNKQNIRKIACVCVLRIRSFAFFFLVHTQQQWRIQIKSSIHKIRKFRVFYSPRKKVLIKSP